MRKSESSIIAPVKVKQRGGVRGRMSEVGGRMSEDRRQLIANS